MNNRIRSVQGIVRKWVKDPKNEPRGFKWENHCVEGEIPQGLEYFQGTYQNRPIETSLYQYETPDMVDVVFLDTGTQGMLETARVPWAEVQLN